MVNPTVRQVIWPALCLLLVVVAGADAWLSASSPRARERAAVSRASAVQVALNAMPYRHGPWIGIDDEPPALPAALDPDSCAWLRRTYTDILTGRAVQLVVLYCGNAGSQPGFSPDGFFTDLGLEIRTTEAVELGPGVPAVHRELQRLAGLDRTTTDGISLIATRTGWQSPPTAGPTALTHLLIPHAGDQAGDPLGIATDLMPLLDTVPAALAAGEAGHDPS